MQIREVAERVLFGDSWEEKLLRPDRCDDSDPGTAIATPRVPGRPLALALDSWKARDKVRFGAVRSLHTEKDRGLVLHFFANHELLALELMALALLKFPGAPSKFRRGLLQTLYDEQEHLRLYRERMTQVGIEFGEIPVSDFFWKTIAPMASPMQFVTRLSMTLEQANLDYALHYAGLYGELGDGDTKAILDRVYVDEIGHVKHGLTWFNRWRDPEASEWEAYAGALSPPLTPNRAKGIGFNRQGRRQAGLSEAFIDELSLYARSRGRCPSVFWFNPACESEVAARDNGTFTPSAPVQSLQKDLASLPIFLGVRDDAVLVPQRPTSSFLRQLQEAGFTLPEFVEAAAGIEATDLVDRDVGRLCPWGRSPGAARYLQSLAGNQPDGASELWLSRLRPIYSKAFGAAQLRRFLQSREPDDWLCDDAVVGVSCDSVAAVQARLDQLRARGWQRAVAKANFGASGRDQIQFGDAPPRPSQLGWLENVIQHQGTVVVEPWLDRLVDLSLLLDVADGRCRSLGWTRFITNQRGQYLGSFVQGRIDGLAPAVRRFLYGGGKEPKRLQHLADALVAQLERPLLDAGVVGPVGIDMIVYCDRAGAGARELVGGQGHGDSSDEGDGQLRLKPIVEINPRYTMGHLAWRLARHVNAARTAVWLILRCADVEAAGFASPQAFATQVRERHPLRLTPNGEQISTGAIFTTDPSQAEMFLSLLVVDESLEGCKEMFAAWPGRIGQWRLLC